jgi:hypothetical protein
LVGALVEILAGRGLFLLFTFIGLFLSNPFTHMVISPLLWIGFPSQLAHFLGEVDYGSSNAIYALVGGLAGILARPMWLFIPFMINGLIFCWMRESWLGFHHVFSLILGFWLCRRVVSQKIAK